MTTPLVDPSSLRAQLVTNRDDSPTYTTVRETDARTALTRGLSEYLQDTLHTIVAGRAVRLAKVFDTYPGQQEIQELPAMAVTSDATLEYDQGNLGPATLDWITVPIPLPAASLPPTPAQNLWALLNTSYLDTALTVELWAADNTSRMGLMMALEDAMVPVGWQFGVRLALPFYFGAYATYSLNSALYVDDGESAQRRYRRILVTVEAEVPVFKVVQGPSSKPRAALTTDDGPTEAISVEKSGGPVFKR